MTLAPEAPARATIPTFLELEITSRCQLTCEHCYAEAGPTRCHGTMTDEEWRRVIAEAARIGVTKIQLIGGEPTQHPQFAELLMHGLNCGLQVQVYSNLYRVLPPWWDLFRHSRVSLGTSYYSDQAEEHDAITGRPGSHARTRANIIQAIGLNIPLQVGIIHMREGQRTEQARAEMEALGITRVHVDHVRQIGNAATTAATLPSVTQLCGNCAQNTVAVLPDGSVAPCVLGRFLPAGRVQDEGLAAIFAGEKWSEIRAMIPPRGGRGCTPDEDSCMPSPGMASCGPADCEPADSDSCQPKGNTPCGPMSSVSAGRSPNGQSYQHGPASLPTYP